MFLPDSQGELKIFVGYVSCWPTWTMIDSKTPGLSKLADKRPQKTRATRAPELRAMQFSLPFETREKDQ
jgi:hypothetical protein